MRIAVAPVRAAVRTPVRTAVRRILPLIGALVLLAFAGVYPVAAASGWQAPVRPVRVTRAFEPPPTPYAAGHRGVDLAGRPGEPVVAASAGVVSFAGPLAGRDVVVVVHGALRTTYEPVLAEVRRGAQVARGQRIGTLAPGHLGCPVAACLHWGLLRGAVYLNPMSLLAAPRIRLLPPAGIAAADPSTYAQWPDPGRLATTGGNQEAALVTPAASLGPSPVTWSLVALAGAGTVVALRRR